MIDSVEVWQQQANELLAQSGIPFEATRLKKMRTARNYFNRRISPQEAAIHILQELKVR